MLKKYKYIITYLLLLTILFSIIPVITYAAVPTVAELNGIKSLRTTEGFTNITDDIIISDATKVKSDGKVLITNKTVNGKYKYFNVGVYREYDIIVYGERHGTKDKFGEYRYLGWDEKTIEVTNDRFQNDADSSTDLTKKSWIVVDERELSWESFAKYQEQIDQILTKKPIENDGASINLSISDILANRTTSSNIKKYVQVMVGPRLTSKGTVKLQHRTSNGKLWYDTFTIPKLDYNFTAPEVSIAAKPGTYIINETDTEISIPIDVTSKFSMSPPLGKTPAQIIQIDSTKPGMLRLSYEGAKQDALISGSTAKATYNKTFKRTDLKVGANVVPITGYLDYAESIYGDQWKGIAGSNTVTIEVKAPNEPYVDLTATPVPDSVKFADADVPVKVNVSAALQGYTNISNINNIVIYARFDDAPANVFQTKTLAASTTASTSFDFLIPKSKVTGDSFSQKFKVTVLFNYKTPVNSNTNASGTAYCATSIYKEEPLPVVPGNMPPKAVLRGPSEVKAGDDVDLDGSDSYDMDGFITDYFWEMLGAVEPILWGNAGVVWYEEEGTYDVKLRVVDDGGLQNAITKSIVVLPPTPEARINLSGTLKENRRITIDASVSTSPKHYPIIWPNTTWSLTAISGNSVSDIKYNGVLNGSKIKDILVKRVGTDRLNIGVFNTKGLSDALSTNLYIAPDKPPIADFSTVTTVLRNPDDTNYSTITINDTSYSTDNDYIKNIILTMSYDSDNNVDFNNGSIQIDAAAYTNGQIKTVTTPWGFDVLITVYKPIGMPVQFDIKTNNVGKYNIDLKAIEGFGQETIPEFITEADYRYDDTTDKPNIEKTVEVINLAPVAGFNMTNKRKVDIVIALPDNYSQTTVQSQLNSKVIPELVANNIGYDIRFVSYDAYKPQPVDNYHYFGFTSKSNGTLRVYQYNNTTRIAGYLSGSRYNTDAELFIANANITWLKAENYIYLGDGESSLYDTIRKYDGNNGYTTTTVFNTYADAKRDKHGPITALTMNKDGTIFWTYKGVRYGRTVSGTSNFTISAGNTIDQGKSYSQLSTTSPAGVKYTTESYESSQRDYKRVVGTKEGNRTVLHSQRADSEDYEYYIQGRYYPTADLYTIDEAFNSIIWKDGYESYFVPLSSNVMTELDKSAIVSNIIADSLINNVTIVALGNSLNKPQFEGLIEKNDGSGLYTNVTNLDTAFTKLEDYILKRINVDLVFNLGQSAHTLDTLKAKVNSILKPKLAAGNISASVSYISSASDMNSALSSALWNPLKDHMFIQVQDTLIADLNDSIKRSSILDALRGNEADIIGLGRSANASQVNNLVNMNSSEGKFFDNTLLEAAINSLGDYVVANARRKSPNVYKYVILGEEVQYSTTYKDIENDPMYSERWKYTHNETYFENNLGRISDSGAYRTTPYTLFNKTGKYEITYGARDNPKNNNLFDNYRLWSNEDLSKATILVHRRPVAAYLWNITYSATTYKYNIVTTDTSEDLDHLSRIDKGIVQKQWKWRLPTDISWQMGVPTEIQKGNTYLLQLIVQDMEGAWSEPYTQEIEVPSLVVDAVPPFRDWANTDVNVNVITTRTGSSTLQRVDYKWTNDRKMPASGWLSNIAYSFNTVQTLNGEWFLHMSGYDNFGASYYLYKGPYRIDKIAPVIVPDKTTTESSLPITVNIEVTDAGGSGIKEVKYAWSKETSKPTSGWAATSDNFSTTQDLEGLWYLHIEATDNAGNVTYECLGTYKVDSFILEKFRVVMVRDLQLEDYYYNSSTGIYDDIPLYVNRMALDDVSFGSMVDGLTKGYKFEFEIDSRNFNENADTIIIEPRFYTANVFARDSAERDLYWEDSSHEVFKAGEGGHSSWKTIKLETSDRIIGVGDKATWRGEYLIPGSAWAVPKGTAKAQAKAKDLKKDIIVSFHIKGYKDGVLKFDYNAEQWGKERTTNKYPYLIGDVIKYNWDKNCLDDIIAKDNR